MYRRTTRAKQRASQRGLIDAPRLRFDDGGPELPATTRSPLYDAPAVESRHPTWWQCWRIQVEDGTARRVLLAEYRTEDDAMKFALSQAARVEVTKWGDRQRLWHNGRPIRGTGGLDQR
jgi:predicted RNA-binding protein with PUA-like domain